MLKLAEVCPASWRARAFGPHSCIGKTPHETPGLAEAAKRSLLRRGLAKDADSVRVYKCPRCFKYHVGHPVVRREA